MATLKDYRDERLKKLAQLRELGIDPFPAESHRTHKLNQIIEDFDSLEGEQAAVVGRIISLRKFGKLAFVVIKDDSAKLQLFLKADDMQQLNSDENILGIEQISLLDTGDYVEATGEIIRTKTGEISLAVKELRLLTKTLRPTPENLSDKEERLRRRYLDMRVNDNVYERYKRRSKFWQATRDYLNQNGFLEINIPVLEHTTGGADANPFVTHMDALDQDFYLRISQELPLKRLIGGGYEKVFEIGPRFRNENYTDEHLPEHVALEWYWAYADWQKGMDLLVGAIDAIVAKNVRVVILGSGDAGLEATLYAKQHQHPTHVAIHTGYDESLSHLMQGGCDAILIPSRFEPCGLTQLYGLRYGCVPVITRVGGLNDTLIDANLAAVNAGVATGIACHEITADGIIHAIDRLVQLYAQPNVWQAIQTAGMNTDVSWANSAQLYKQLY